MNRIELDNRKKAVKILKSMGWDTMPMENKAHNGTPDLNAAKCMGFESAEIWIEFKIVEEWPKKQSTPIKIRHFTPQQKAWFRLRIMHNPNCFIIVQVEEEHFLYTVHPNVLECLGSSWTERQMYSHANFVSTRLDNILYNLEKGIL